MEVAKLSVEFRGVQGKSDVRRLRVAGKIPAICYGGGVDPILLTVDPTALIRSLDPLKKTNTLLTLSVKGAPGGDQEILAMVRDYQKDALRGDLTHADFIRVQMDKDVRATVPLVLIGKPEGAKKGGILHQVIRNLEIACTPDKIPVKLEIDVSKLELGEAIHVSDLKLAAGVKPIGGGTQTVCSVTAPKAEKVETPTAEAAAADAAAAAGAPAAAGAAGAPAAAGAAAAKPGDAKAAAGAAKDPKAAGGDKKK